MKLLLLIILLFSFTLGNEVVGIITKIQGKVKILKDGEIRKIAAIEKQELYKNDLIITYKKAMANIELNDGSKITLAPKSKLSLKNNNNLKQHNGKIYYNIQKRGSIGLKVATNFSIIGVKGTQFIITDEDGNKSLSLKEGLVGVSSLDKEFELHKKSIYDEMEAFKKEFNQYKDEEKKEFLQYTKSFDLQENQTILFNKNRVNQSVMDEKSKNEFLNFENFQNY